MTPEPSDGSFSRDGERCFLFPGLEGFWSLSPGGIGRRKGEPSPRSMAAEAGREAMTFTTLGITDCETRTYSRLICARSGTSVVATGGSVAGVNVVVGRSAACSAWIPACLRVHHQSSPTMSINQVTTRKKRFMECHHNACGAGFLQMKFSPGQNKPFRCISVS